MKKQSAKREACGDVSIASAELVRVIGGAGAETNEEPPPPKSPPKIPTKPNGLP